MGSPITPPIQKETAMNPIIDIQIGDETLFVVFDYWVAKDVLRRTGVNPMTSGIHGIINTENGIEVLFHSMLTAWGPKQPIPEEQRDFTLETVCTWFEDLSVYVTIYNAVTQSFVRALTKAAKNVVKAEPEAKGEGEQGDPPV